jgi:heat shock protein HslJ
MKMMNELVIMFGRVKMKKIFFAFVLVAVMLVSCKSVPVSSESNFPKIDFSGITGKEWKLIEVRINGTNSGFDRRSLVRDGYTEAFTLNFDAEFISGIGAPNRYSAPYSLGAGQEIKINVVRATLMAPIREPEKLREHNYFNYIQNSYKWNQVNNNLELLSKDTNGGEVILIFSQ